MTRFRLTDDYTLSSGAGAWSTDITIAPDGTFTGMYHNTDFAEEGEGYSAIYDFSDFHGSFTGLRYVNEYTYAFEMDSLVYDSEVGLEELVEMYGEKIKRVFTTAYGIEDGETFYFYAKGAPVDKLPDDFVWWVSLPTGLSSFADVLPFNGLYNENGKFGFFFSGIDDRTKEWSELYRDFVLNEGFLMNQIDYPFFRDVNGEKDLDSIYIGMKDISGDGVPELFMSNEDASEAGFANYAFTVDNGRVVYAGGAGGRHKWLTVDRSGGYRGVFCLYGAWGMYGCDYYTLRDGKIEVEMVFTVYDEDSMEMNGIPGNDIYETADSEMYGTILYYKRTDDLALYEAAKIAEAPGKMFTTSDPDPSTLRHFSLSEIRSLGWDEFVKQATD